jgi:adenylosuccinate synthase
MIYIVQGGQYGSEGKGQIVDWLCSYLAPTAVIRTGSINAGHTMHHEGKIYKMQQIPCGWAHPSVNLLIGPGAYIHPRTLRREVEDLEARAGINVRDRLLIDPRAGVHLDEHEGKAKLENRHHLIGATGKGCAEAIVNKIENRGKPSGILFKDWLKDQYGWGWVKFADTSVLVDALDGSDVIIEGTQGTHLDMHLGPYPYTTSRMTTAANWVAESGLSPGRDYRVILVVRTYPIRVAGPSGPLPQEIPWWNLWREWRGHAMAPQVNEDSIRIWRDKMEEIAKRDFLSSWPPKDSDPRRHEVRSEVPSLALLNMQTTWFKHWKEICGAIEMTTVTNKPRRIAQLDYDVLHQSAVIEKPWRTVVTFLNYKFPTTWGSQAPPGYGHSLWPNEARPYLHHIGEVTGAPVLATTTGPGREHVHRLIQ